MANNNFLTDDIIVKQALRLLKNNCVALPLVYREYEQKFGKVGDTIRLELPYRTLDAEGPTLQLQPMVDLNTTLTIDRHRHVGLNYGQKDRRLSIQMFSERYLNSAVIHLANSVDRSILATLKACFHSSGIPGTTPGSYAAFSNAYAKQTDYAVPDDGMRRAVVNPVTCAVISNEVKGLFNERMVKDSYVKGYKGDIAGYSLHETQNLPKHTVGAGGGTPLVAGAGQTGNSIATDGWPASTPVLNAGDVITFAGVFGVNPQNYTTTGRLQEFVVQSDVTSDGAGLATISLAPALNDGSTTTTNPNGQTVSLAAYQNVTNAPADNAAITILGSPGVTYDQNYLFHKECIAAAMIDFEPPEVATVAKTARDSQTGISMLLTGGYDITNFQSLYRLDVLWGVKAVYPELGLRLWGANAS